MATRSSRSSKYKNQKATRQTESGAVLTFDSQKEAKRYDQLCNMLRAGLIRNLRLQQNFTILEGFTHADSGERVKPVVYKADFTYELKRGWNGNATIWRPVVEDVKGMRTKDYILKRKMMADKFNIIVQEIHEV